MIAANDAHTVLPGLSNVQLSTLIAQAVGLLIHRGEYDRAASTLRNVARAASIELAQKHD